MERIARKTIDPEEYEQHMVAREQQREALLNYHVVERVINSRDGEDGTEYFVKCRCTFVLYP
jgi:chromodomain-helicase-DNA-binding protein 1